MYNRVIKRPSSKKQLQQQSLITLKHLLFAILIIFPWIGSESLRKKAETAQGRGSVVP